MSPTVEVVSHGPAGVLNYREGSNIHTFDWEFGAADVIMSVYVPAPADWDTAIPWAAGRRTEVLGYIGLKLAWQHFPPGRFEIGERRIDVREAGPSWRIVRAWIAARWR